MSEKLPLSIVVMTKNEEIHIRKCLESVSFADEIFVVDSGSSDRTVEIANQYDIRVVPFVWNGKLPKKKNWCLKNLPFSNEWVLMVDADEEVTEAVKKEIDRIVTLGSEYSGFVVRFYYHFMGRTIKHGDPVRKLILFRHRLAQFSSTDDAPNREVEGSEQPLIEGPVGQLKAPMVHRNLKCLEDYFGRHNAYSTRLAYLLFHHRYGDGGQAAVRASLFGSQPERREFARQIFRHLPFKASVYFLYSYFLRLGFLDGTAGLHYNLCKAFFYYQTSLKFAELQLQKN